ncbi:MAG: hypothetical protein MRY32_02670 [Rickettsiales bacterium]|nr:hypothetical protein [Rickettsiales bacterium]
MNDRKTESQSIGSIKPALSSPSENVYQPPKASPSRFRLLPLTMSMMGLMLIVKIADLYQGSVELGEVWNIPEAQAAEEKTEESEDKKEMAEEDAEKEGDEEDKDAKKEGEESPDDVELAKLNNEPGLSVKERKKEYSQIELDILQSLSERREEIEKRSREIDLKDKLLQATELRINDKINEIKQIKGEVQDLLKEYSQEEKRKVQGLVKIYENMKAKDAAQIFDELEMTILLQVVDKMSARKVAPILAQMDPIKAKVVTEQLAQFRRLRDIKRKVSAE